MSPGLAGTSYIEHHWKQFPVSINTKTQLADPEKMAYLRHTVKEGPSMPVFEGLLQSAKNYTEAIKCLQKWYNHP